MRMVKMKTMFFHKSRLLQLSAIALVTLAVCLYKMTTGLPEQPSLKAHSSGLMREGARYRKLSNGHNASFLHPHLIMKANPKFKPSKLRKGKNHVAVDLEEIDGYRSDITSKVKITRPLPHIMELENDTSIILPVGNNSKIWVQMKVIKYTNSKPPLPCFHTFQPESDKDLLDILRHCDPANMTFDPDLELWLHTEEMMCEGRVYIYNKQGAFLRDVILDRSLWSCREGGEDLRQVWNKTKPEDEICKPSLGAFKIYCDEKPVRFFTGSVDNHLTHWLERTVALTEGYSEVDKVVDRLTIAVQRYEYHNMYHSISEVYNAYLVMRFYNKTAEEVNILIIDGHPKGLSDVIWGTVFPHTFRLSSLKPLTLFQRMFWNPQGHFGYFLRLDEDRLAYIEEFRNFILKQFDLEVSSPLNCRRIRLTFISRRDYIRGSINLDGALSRKIKNEDEVVETIKVAFPNFIVDKVQLERFNMKDQLELMVNTDILLGMHGAGLTHVLFLPSHAGVIEFIPAYWFRDDFHFQSLAKWRHLIYTRWVNHDANNEIPGDQYTNLPTYIILDRLRQVLAKLCPMRPL